MTTLVEETIEISTDILLPHLNPSNHEDTDIDNSMNHLDHFEEIVYENLNEDHIIISQENASENTEEVIELDSQVKNEDSDEIELESTLMAVMLPDGSTAFIKNINEHIQYISEEADLIESQDNLITADSLVENENSNNEKPKINLIIEKSQDSSRNVHILTQQSIEISEEATACSPIDEKNEDHLKKKSDEFYYPMLQLEDGSTAYISIPQELLPSMGLCLEENNVNNEEHEESKQIEIVQRPTQENPESNLVVQLTNNTSSEKEKRIRPRQFPCEYENCGKFYTTMHHLKVHERTHTGAKPYRCPISNCVKAFATGYGRKAHIRTHTGEKPYECPMESCTKSFKTSGDLQKHVRTHTGERPFLCPVAGCGRRFTTSNIRKVHVRTHTGEKPYVCTEVSCQRAFASATNFKNHIRIHTGEKPYVCQVKDCGKRFTEYSSLYKHALVHTHFRPYACDLCPRRYRQVSNLSMHKRTFHGILEADDGTQLVLNDTVLAITRNSKKIRGINCQNFLFNKENNTLIAIPSENDPLGMEEEQEDANLEANEEESIEERDETSYLYLTQDLIRLEYDFQEDSENTSIETGESITIDPLSIETD